MEYPLARIVLGFCPGKDRTGQPPFPPVVHYWGIFPGQNRTGYPQQDKTGVLPKSGLGYLPAPPPPLRQKSIASSCYMAGDMPLAFTQKDCLVLRHILNWKIEWHTPSNLSVSKYNKYNTGQKQRTRSVNFVLLVTQGKTRIYQFYVIELENIFSRLDQLYLLCEIRQSITIAAALNLSESHNFTNFLSIANPSSWSYGLLWWFLCCW